MNEPSRERWLHLGNSLRASGDSENWYHQLARLYSEPQRHYHTLQHIGHCLLEFDEAAHLTGNPKAVEVALWFHDAIYEPRAHNNEERSAELAGRFLAETEAGPEFCNVVTQHILATRHHTGEPGSDSLIVVDIDLAILGQARAVFDDYERRIRLEYSWVAEHLFAEKRAEILRRFLTREKIYSSELFSTKYEAAARENLARSISRLEQWCGEAAG